MNKKMPEAKKSLGQHWLSDLASLESIAEAADVQAGDMVLEIGPGTGTLTDVLLQKDAKVIALEVDKNRIRDLEIKYKDHSSADISIQESDVRAYDLTKMPDDYKIVANIPYYLTANLLRKLVDDDPKPEVAALLVQKEVAERVAAKPGDLSQITVFVQVFYDVSLGAEVPAYLFTPPPKVDSQVLVLRRRQQTLVPWSEHFIQIVKAGFSEKRKKLRSSLSSGLGLPKSTIESALTSADLPANARAQELPLDAWHRLTKILDVLIINK